MLADTKYVSTLSDVLLDVVVRALVRELSQSDLLARELLIQIVLFETGWGKILHGWWKNGSLEGWHGSLELGWNQGQGLMLESYKSKELKCLWNQISIKLVQFLIVESHEISRQFVTFLQA